METDMTIFPRAAALALILTAASTSAALAQTSAASEAVFRATTLNLNATGEVLAAPDMAVIGLGVTTTSRTAAEAMAADNQNLHSVHVTLPDIESHCLYDYFTRIALCQHDGESGSLAEFGVQNDSMLQ